MSGIATNYPSAIPAKTTQYLDSPTFLEAVSDLVKDAIQGTINREEAIKKSEEILVSINQLFNGNPSSDQLDVIGKTLSLLLKLPFEELQQQVAPLLTALLIDAVSLNRETQNIPLPFFIEMEEQISTLLNQDVRQEKKATVLIPLLNLYQQIVTRLFLVRHAIKNSEFSLTIEQNHRPMISRTMEWLPFLLKSLDPNLTVQAKEIHNTLNQMQEPLPSNLRQMMDKLPEIFKSEYSDLSFFIFMRKLHSAINNERQAFVYQNVGQTTADQHIKKLSLIMKSSDRAKVTIFKIIGITLMNLADYDQATEALQEAKRIAEQLDDNNLSFEINITISYLYQYQKNYKEEINYIKTAITFAKKLHNAELIKKLYQHLMSKYYSIADYEEATNALAELCTTVAKPDESIWCSLAIGLIIKGDYEAALCILLKGLEVVQDLRTKGEICVQLCKVYNKLGDLSRAKEFELKALDITLQLLVTEAPLSDAVSLFYQSVELSEHDPVPLTNFFPIDFHEVPSESVTYRRQGDEFMRQQQFDKAAEQYERSFELEEKSEHPNVVDDLMVRALLHAYSQTNAFDKAISFLQKVSIKYQQQQELGNEASCYDLLGLLFGEHKKDSIKAEEYFRKSIDIYSIMQLKIMERDRERGITFFEQQAMAYRGLESALMHQPAKKESAFIISDARRAQSLYSILTKKLKTFGIEISPGYQLDFAQVKKIVSQQQITLVAYSLCPEFHFEGSKIKSEPQLYAWIITPDGKFEKRPLPLEKIKEDLDNIDELFEYFPFSRDSEESRTPSWTYTHTIEALIQAERGPNEKIDENLREASKAFIGRLEDWYATFIQPIQDLLPKDPKQTVMIIPDSFLAHLPFAAFRNQQGEYLIQDHPIAYAPSLRILHLLSLYPQKLDSASLVVGNPSTPHAKSLDLAAEEAKKVHDILETPPQNLLLNATATVGELKAKIEGCRYIHLACHGEGGKRMEQHSIFEGRLLLTPEQGNVDGYFYAQQSADLRLNTELVFLSSCCSGTGKLLQEGSIGQIWSFLAAGSRSTITTQWELPESDLTKNMVIDFYKSMLGIASDKMTKAQALQHAMQIGIEQEKNMPHRWASLFLTGIPN